MLTKSSQSYKVHTKDELCYTIIANRLQVIVAQYSPNLAFAHGACLALYSVDSDW